jgi:hypothetical protein
MECPRRYARSPRPGISAAPRYCSVLPRTGAALEERREEQIGPLLGNPGDRAEPLGALGEAGVVVDADHDDAQPGFAR